MVLDPDANEVRRLEGYLPKDEVRVFLELGLARVAFMRKDWAVAEKHYANVVNEFPESKFAPEAVYYLGVSRYSASHDGEDLANAAKTLAEKYPDSAWRLRSLPWDAKRAEAKG